MAYCDIISMERPPVTRGEFLDIVGYRKNQCD